MEARLAQVGSQLILVLAQLGYVSSAGLRFLLKLAKNTAANSIQLKVCNFHEHVLEIIEVSVFSKVLSMHGTIADGL